MGSFWYPHLVLNYVTGTGESVVECSVASSVDTKLIPVRMIIVLKERNGTGGVFSKRPVVLTLTLQASVPVHRAFSISAVSDAVDAMDDDDAHFSHNSWLLQTSK